MSGESRVSLLKEWQYVFQDVLKIEEAQETAPLDCNPKAKHQFEGVMSVLDSQTHGFTFGGEPVEHLLRLVSLRQAIDEALSVLERQLTLLTSAVQESHCTDPAECPSLQSVLMFPKCESFA
jgi:hypothetical protein